MAGRHAKRKRENKKNGKKERKRGREGEKRDRRMERGKKRGKIQEKEGENKLPSICICDMELRELQPYIVPLSIANVYYVCYY